MDKAAVLVFPDILQLELNFGYLSSEWQLHVHYDFSLVMGNVLEAYLKRVGGGSAEACAMSEVGKFMREILHQSLMD